MVNLLKPSEALGRAADILERDGWCTGAYVRGLDYGDPEIPHAEGQRCAEGALMAALGVTRLWHRSHTAATLDEIVSSAAVKYLANSANVSPGSIADWNDAQTDPSVVIDTMRHAAKRAREDGG